MISKVLKSNYIFGKIERYLHERDLRFTEEKEIVISSNISKKSTFLESN